MDSINFQLVPNQFHLKLMDVAGVATDSQDRVFFTTRNTGGDPCPVVALDKQGKFLRGFGGGIVRNAHGICIDYEDNVLISDAARNCVFKFSPDGELLMTIGTPDSKPTTGCVNYDYNTIQRAGEPFGHPSKVDTSANGDIFVADGYGNGRVHHFDKHGKLIKSWGAPGSGAGEFHIPHGIGVDRENSDVYICDRENFRIQIFDVEGNLKQIWDDIYRPTDVVIRDGLVYVAELGDMMFVDNVLFEPGGPDHRHYSRVRIFDKQGKALYQIGGPDSGKAGNFFSLHGLCLDSEGSIYTGEVNWPNEDVWTSYPQGQGMSEWTHKKLQKFMKI